MQLHSAGFAYLPAKPMLAMNETGMRHAIEQKRDGGGLSDHQWHDVVAGFMTGTIDEAQMAALCMACLWRGLSFEETFALTDAMVQSGETLHFDGGTVVDKHSSGGVSDIVSLLAVPLAAACGARVAKLSGRALGHTGGTIDKLEMIPGFNVRLSTKAFVAQVEGVGCAIGAQTDTLVPADKRMYTLRDRTGSVPCMGLMAASIVSKKIAGGAHAFVFDVKTGQGAMLRDVSQATELARWLVEISRRFARKATAFVSNMDEPLGRTIGTGIEVIEAREFLRGTYQGVRARELVLRIVEEMLMLSDITGGRSRAEDALASGAAYEKFVEMIEAQGGSRTTFEALQIDNERSHIVAAPKAGFIQSVDIVRLGNLGRTLSTADPFGGLSMNVHIGDRVDQGQLLLRDYGGGMDEARDLENAFEISDIAPEAEPLIYEIIRA